jgi:hypothetical protein
MGAGQDDDQRFEKVSASLGRRQFVISCNLQSAPIRFDGALMGLGSPTSLKAEADHRSCSCWASRSAAALECCFVSYWRGLSCKYPLCICV